ncbi:RICIN domain-containing protein [Actinacidiphila oryziradicis]|uniref:RICIN domain-containing protein n=1 Tax=Actinacidiphila oryziradicis TaxID=2571141 RepID=UPI0023F48ED8|nr:RICIN domain-containing protein [Actinacidiphila oryziradicis]MCW2871899.1 hypothetical protein [Actinacidiphila oryziradicis]
MDPRGSNSGGVGHLTEESDQSLAAELRGSSGMKPGDYPVTELLARHWEPVFEYATLCTGSTQAAGMLTTAAFTRVFAEVQRQTGLTAVWRPRLLATVRAIAREWDTDQRRTALHPGLRTGAKGRGSADARFTTPEDRRLVFRAFSELPKPAQCLLWHAEVEAEDVAVPARLLGLGHDFHGVLAQLEQARELLRDGCLQAHLELAPDDKCRQFSRLLDVSVRRGGTSLDPDLRRHMARCDHCRYTAVQLDHSRGRLALFLAEAVIGWGARDYLGSRPARRAAQLGAIPATAPTSAAAAVLVPVPDASGRDVGPRHSVGGRPRVRSRVPAGRQALGAVLDRRPVLAGLGIAGGGVLALTMLFGALSGHSTTIGTTSGGTTVGVGAASPAPDPAQSQAAAGSLADGAMSGRLRNAETGLCLGIHGGQPELHAEAEAATCTASQAQQWSYETDGLLRSLADPDLCLNSHQDFALELGTCTAASEASAADVRYDLTIQGNLIPQWNQQLAVVPVSRERAAAAVLKSRDGSAAQRWALDTSGPSPQYQSVGLTVVGSLAPVGVTLPPARPTPTASATPTLSSSPSHSATVSPSPSSAGPSPTTESPCGGYCPPGDGSWGGGGGGWGGGGSRGGH